MSSYGWEGYGPYISKAEKIKKAEKSREKLAKKGIIVEPVIVEGRTITRTWWGQSWVSNLERYADYSNRLPRGRSYLRNGSILDLKIAQNSISALVSGSRSSPYKVDIKIEPLSHSLKNELMKMSRESLDSMQSLLAGEFPQELKEQFFKQGTGLFPSPKEITLNCSCPDWASMCKHVAAALYGTAVRLDEKPELFFTLRGIDINSFVASVAKEESAKLLKKASVQSGRVLSTDGSGDDIGELFGISFDMVGEDNYKGPATIENIAESGIPEVKRTKKKVTKNVSGGSIKTVGKRSDSAKSAKKVVKKAVKKPVKKVIAKKKAQKATKKTVKKK